jgi:hypothetical protein
MKEAMREYEDLKERAEQARLRYYEEIRKLYRDTSYSMRDIQARTHFANISAIGRICRGMGVEKRTLT